MKDLIKGIFCICLRKKYMRQLRWVMRGHRRLKNSDSQGKIYAVMHAVSKAEFCKNGVYSKLMFGAAFGNAELVVRQYLLMRLMLATKMSKLLLYAIGKPGAHVVHPLPPPWRESVRSFGFKVPKLWSALIWQSYLFLFTLYGILSIQKQILLGIKTIVCRSLFPKDFVFFDGLTAGNLGDPKNITSNNIVSWYMNWPEKISQPDALCHQVKGRDIYFHETTPVLRVPSAIPPLGEFKLLRKYLSWSFAAVFLVIADLVRGRWWHALLLREASMAALARIQYPDKLARDYLFHNSNWAYRPLWTYEAKQKGSRILFYFYSASCGEGFKRPQGYPPLYFGFKTMNWPLYLVWDDYQANAVRQAVGEDANVSVVGPIHFHSSVGTILTLPVSTIAVFDVQPMRNAFYECFGIAFDYYTPHTVNQFLSDIYDATKERGGKLAFKRKRHMGRLVHPRYRHFVCNLEKLDGFLNIDPDLSAFQLIKECMAVISLPFTSTAVIGKALGKPSVYYDPHGVIQKDDRAAHGIEILHGPKELSRWLASIHYIEKNHATCC
jgi:polysaccharide biosynthesis PFTS motif protein